MLRLSVFLKPLVGNTTDLRRAGLDSPGFPGGSLTTCTEPLTRSTEPADLYTSVAELRKILYYSTRILPQASASNVDLS
jgi:hypothetical protein